MRYGGQRAVIIGASGGIGRAITNELLDNGADIALTYHRNRAEADRQIARAAALNRRCVAYGVDLCDRAAIADCCRALASDLGVPTILVNCAGLVRDTPLSNMRQGDWDEIVAANLTGPFDVVRQIAPMMVRNGGGRILNVSSVSGLHGQPGQANYAAAKGGIIAMTKALARELGPFNITVNALAPGFVETEMLSGISAGHRRRLMERIPLRRFATPDDLVPAARLLIAPDGAYVTGHVLIVDGGLTA
jgi:3-oxoacyl-[acyl-carrier protein] reductase